MARIRAIKIEYYDMPGCAYKEFPEDRTVTITADVTYTEKIVWKWGKQNGNERLGTRRLHPRTHEKHIL